MGNSDINKKRRILDLIDELGLDGTITIQELKGMVKVDVVAYDKVVAQTEAKVVKEFKNVYLKRYSNDKLWGDEVELLHITSVKTNSYNTDYERMYDIKATQISINKMNVRMGKLSHGNHKTEDSLRSYDVIDKTEFEVFTQAYKCIDGQISDLVAQ